MSVVEVSSVRAILEPFRWDWAEAESVRIERHWAARIAERPRLFNGRVLMVSGLAIADGRATVRFFATDYARLLAWIDWGCPDPGVFNGFAVGALQARDGAFLLGRMAPHTANAGRLYFPCGTPDESDVTADGTVDLTGSILREIAEETGFAPADLTVAPAWTIVTDGGLAAFMRRVALDLDAGDALARVRRHLAAERQPELSEVVAVSCLADLDRVATPGVVPLYLERAFGVAGQR